MPKKKTTVGGYFLLSIDFHVFVKIKHARSGDSYRTLHKTKIRLWNKFTHKLRLVNNTSY